MVPPMGMAVVPATAAATAYRAAGYSGCGSSSRSTAGNSPRDRGPAAAGRYERSCQQEAHHELCCPPTVVIADDQALVRGGFRLILKAAGIDVLAEAADGEQAVAAVLKHRPDVVLMDIRMPGLDGIEATRRIVAAGPSRRTG